MSSLLEMLLSEPGPEQKLAQLLPMIQGASDPQASGGGFDGIGTSSSADNPWGLDVSGNIVTRHGDTFDLDAMRSLRQAAHATGIKPWQFTGGTFRSIADSNALYNSRYVNGVKKPGVLPAAPGGKSMHNYGLAFDQTRELPALLRRWLLNHGWYNGASFGDPVHWSYGRSG